MSKKEKDWRRSEPAKTGHTILLPTKFRDNPTCPHHGKKAIIREPYDELGGTRWFCIDCIAHAIYDIRPYIWDLKQAVKKHEWEEAMKIIEEMEKEGLT
jgi:pentatricopeptide repeat protein